MIGYVLCKYDKRNGYICDSEHHNILPIERIKAFGSAEYECKVGYREEG